MDREKKIKIQKEFNLILKEELELTKTSNIDNDIYDTLIEINNKLKHQEKEFCSCLYRSFQIRSNRLSRLNLKRLLIRFLNLQIKGEI